MTENKRFKQSYVCGDFGLIDNAQAKGEQWIDLHSMGENGTKNVQICIDIMNDFADENEQLKEIIKFSCVMEICESCKYGKYWITQDYLTGEKEGDFKCLKGHPAEDCCEIMECKDYELKDLDELLKEVE